MKFVIVTGMSGAGKSTVLRFLEDLNFYCIDNLPPSLIPKLAELSYDVNSDIEKIALGVDSRGGKLFDDLLSVIKKLEKQNYEFTILFLDADDDVLVKRFKETRRTHPLAKNERLIVGIEKERELLSSLKKSATHIVDTSQILTRQLKEKISEIFVEDKVFNNLMITVLSFGFKYGIPNDSDLVFDVRFLPNPFYQLELRPLTGNDDIVQRFVMENEVSREFLIKLKDLINFLVPNYVKEGKNQLVISIGCTGGKHRSVTLVNELYKTLQEIGHSVIIQHRDIDKDAKRM